MKTILYLDMWIGERIQEMKIAGIRRFARMAGWTVIPVSEADSRPRKLHGLLKRHHPDGIIVECSASRTDLPPARFGGTPVVYLDCTRTLYGSTACRVVHDGKATVKAMFRELSSNRPSAYGFVGYRSRRAWSVFRERAFGVLVKESGAAFTAFPSRRESEDVRQRRLAAWIAGLPRKSAVFAANDETALEVLMAAKAAGRDVPRDFTLAGVDNLVPDGAEIELTSIQVDSERAGYKAAALLQRQMDGGRGDRIDTYGPLVTVRRESTRGFGRRAPQILDAIAFIREHACEGLRARDVIAHVGGSRRLVELRFRETVGHSILDEIGSVRMERVMQLLRDKSVSLAVVIDQSGFPSAAALRKAFRLRTGHSLLAWRKANG